MKGSIYLIGGGEIADGRTRPIDEELMALAPSGSKFTFFGFASHDDPEYAAVIRSVFGQKFQITLPTKSGGRQAAMAAIQSASVIYLGGGDTDRLLELFNEWGLVDYLSAAIERGVHVAGMSAGALALSTWYIHESANEFELKQGWGIIDIGVQVHASEDTWANARLLWEGSNVSRAVPLIAIGECAAWRIDLAGQRKVGAGSIWVTPEIENI